MPWDEISPTDFPALHKDLDGISRQTMEDHYKLYQGYVKKTNQLRGKLKEIDYAEAEGNQVYSEIRALATDNYTFALLGYKNHELYFNQLGGEGGADPQGAIADALEDEFHGGVENWKNAIRKQARAARGWVILGYDLDDGSLFNYMLDTQNLWAVYSMVPVLALDVYEHAYARDFGSTPDGRGEYVEAYFRNLDWDNVNKQLARAKAARDAAGAAG